MVNSSKTIEQQSENFPRGSKTFLQKRILVYGQIPPPRHGSNIMTELFLKSLNYIGYKCELSQRSYSKDIAEVNKISLRKFFRMSSIFWRFLKNLSRLKPHVIVFFVSSRKIGILVEAFIIKVARICGFPLVLYIHTNAPQMIYSSGVLGRLLVSSVFRQADAIFVLGRVSKDKIQEFYEGQVYILPNCLENNINYLRKKREDPLTKILFLSNLSENKGLLTLIKAIPHVVSKNKNVEFLIVGPWQDNQLRKEVYKLINRNRLERYVKFTGPKYDNEKRKLLSSSDIFVFPGYNDSFALVNLEAMSAGLPIISSKVGAMEEIILEGKTGFLVPPKEEKAIAKKINFLLEHPELRYEMGENARKRLENFYSVKAYRENLRRIMAEVFIDI